jgi:hypothetical protein
MDRRTLIRGLSTVAVLVPMPAYSQTLAKAARVGLLMTTTLVYPVADRLESSRTNPVLGVPVVVEVRDAHSLSSLSGMD